MKNKWIKLSYLLLGATLVFSSCVDTEESPEVIELRKAAAAQLNADVSFRLAQVKFEEAEAASARYRANYDSISYKTQGSTLAAQTEVAIQNAKTQLLTAQIEFERKTKDLEAAKLYNPVLAALVKDYTAYYSGGALSSGGNIPEGIFTLEGKILSENASIISLQNTKDGLVFLQKGKEIQLATLNISLADLQATLKILSDARTTGNFDAAITAAQDLLAKSTADYNKVKLAYDEAVNKAQTASAIWGTASNLYIAADDEKWDAYDNYWDILDNYSSSSDETVAYNAFMTAYNSYIAGESRTQTLLSTWTTKYQAALSEKNTAETAYNAARAAYLNAQAVVDAATINGGTATSAQITDRDTKLTAYNNATTTYNEKNSNYNNVVPEYEDAKSAYENFKYWAAQARIELEDYNKYKNAYNIADAKLPALETDMNGKRDAYYKLAHSRDSLSTISVNANLVKNNDNAVVTLLQNDRNSINTAITNMEVSINTQNESIANLTKEINNLKAGININGGNVLIADQIKTSQEKIAQWQALLTKYQALAAALKVKIDAQN